MTAGSGDKWGDVEYALTALARAEKNIKALEDRVRDLENRTLQGAERARQRQLEATFAEDRSRKGAS